MFALAPYSVSYCKQMIAHYQAETSNWTKPATWHTLARTSVAEWQYRLESALKESE